MKKIEIISVFAAVVFLAGECVFAAEQDTGPFEVGEQLVYDVYFSMMKVGDATMTIKEITRINGRRAYHIVMTNKTTATYSKIFNVDDMFETFLDVEKLVPLKYVKKLVEGDYSTHKVTMFDREKLVADYESLKKSRKTSFSIRPDTQDALSIFYVLRKKKIEIGEKLVFNLVSDGKTYQLEMTPYRRVRKSIYGGSTYDTIQLIPKAKKKGDFFSKGRGWLWVSDDKRRLPVVFRTKLPFGSITFALIKVHNIYEIGPDGPQTVPTGDK